MIKSLSNPLFSQAEFRLNGCGLLDAIKSLTAMIRLTLPARLNIVYFVAHDFYTYVRFSLS